MKNIYNKKIFIISVIAALLAGVVGGLSAETLVQELQKMNGIGIGLLVGSFFVLVVFGIYEYFYNEHLKRFYKSVIDSSPTIIIISDGTKIIDVNKAFLEYFGFDSLQTFQKSNAVCLDDYFTQAKGYLQVVDNGIHWFEYVLNHPQKQHIARLKIGEKVYYFLVTVAKIQTKEGLYSVVLSDITKEEEYKIKLRHSSVSDFLTGVYNRRYFNDKLKEMISLAERYNRTFSLVMLDIDHFKKINDKYGHDFGDKVLREFVGVIRKNIRDIDVFCRTGGEEFTIILPETALKDAVRVAKKLNEIVRNHKGIVSYTISLGVVEYIKGESDQDIYRRADTAMYRAKTSGRDRVVIG